MGLMLYKYRSLTDLRRVIDIVMNHRLYMPHYNELNDPMEGKFMYEQGSVGRDVLSWVCNKKAHIRLCSLSTNRTNTLLWSHYADSHKGCCIELKVTSKLDSIRQEKMNYNDKLPQVTSCNDDNIIKVLRTKSPLWEYEDEVRYFKTMDVDEHGREVGSKFLSVSISRIYLGWRVSEMDCRFYKKLFGPYVSGEKNVIRVKEEDLDTGYLKVQ